MAEIGAAERVHGNGPSVHQRPSEAASFKLPDQAEEWLALLTMPAAQLAQRLSVHTQPTSAIEGVTARPVVRVQMVAANPTRVDFTEVLLSILHLLISDHTKYVQVRRRKLVCCDRTTDVRAGRQAVGTTHGRVAISDCHAAAANAFTPFLPPLAIKTPAFLLLRQFVQHMGQAKHVWFGKRGRALPGQRSRSEP